MTPLGVLIASNTFVNNNMVVMLNVSTTFVSLIVIQWSVQRNMESANMANVYPDVIQWNVPQKVVNVSKVSAR